MHQFFHFQQRTDHKTFLSLHIITVAIRIHTRPGGWKFIRIVSEIKNSKVKIVFVYLPFRETMIKFAPNNLKKYTKKI